MEIQAFTANAKAFAIGAVSDLKLDSGSIRRFENVPRHPISILMHTDIQPRQFDRTVHYFKMEDLKNGFGSAWLCTHRAFMAGKGKDTNPFRVLVTSNELARVRTQLREQRQLSRTKRT